MSTIDPDLIRKIIQDVLREKTGETRPSATTTSAPVAEPQPTISDGVFPDMTSAIEAADRASLQYLDCSMKDRARFIQVIRDVASTDENLRYMAEATVAETGMGRIDHKIVKNRAAALQTPGIEDLVTEAWSGDDGLTTVEFSPFGVIGAITPTTNPTETVINNSIGMLAAGNAVVFSPHPRSTKIIHWLIRELNTALAKAGAPANLIVTVEAPTLTNTRIMMSHPGVRMLVATGGQNVVQTVLASGKKAIGAGAGNPPVVVDQTADIVRAARDIVDGASFDNNLPCIAEKEVLAVECIADQLKSEMVANGAFELTDQAKIAELAAMVAKDGKAVTKWVGKDAAVLLDAIGVDAPASTRLIIAEVPFEHSFVQTELMMPILAIVRAADVVQAIDLAVEAEHGNRHTAIMHSADVNALTAMGKRIQTTVFVKNGPSYAGIGIGGEGFTTFSLAGPTGEGLTSARFFARRRRCALVGGMNIR